MRFLGSPNQRHSQGTMNGCKKCVSQTCPPHHIRYNGWLTVYINLQSSQSFMNKINPSMHPSIHQSIISIHLHPSICVEIQIHKKIVRCLLVLIGSDMPTLNVLVVVTTPENLELASSTHKDNITTFFIHFSCTFNRSFATCNLQDLPHLHVYLTREKKKTRQMAKWSNTHSPQRALKQTSPQFFRGVG